MSQDDDMKRITEEVKGLRVAVFGNGHGRGLKVQVEDLTTNLAAVTTTLARIDNAVKEMAETDAAGMNQRIGSQRTLKQIRALVLFLIAALGVGGTVTINRLFELVASLP